MPASPSFPSPPPPARFARRVANLLLAWYDAEQRDLPWRRSRDPYAILVSEFMLQQTQVATVIPYYLRFLEAFPSVEALAAAPAQEVLQRWAGLGYYTRARNLHAAAQRIVETYGGRVPAQTGDLLFLPGVGPSVAGAVASIAFGIPVPAVDGNVVRVLCRLFALGGSPASLRVRREIEDRAGRLVPQKRPGDFNQALMDLGARICQPAAPACPECPLQTLCEAFRLGMPEAFPAAVPRPAVEEVQEACAVVRSGDRYLVARVPADADRYRGMWEFPAVPLAEGADPAAELKGLLRARYRLSVAVDGNEWARIDHQVTRFKIRKRVFLCAPSGPRRSAAAAADSEDGVLWGTLEEIARLPLGAPHKRILQLLEESAVFFA